MSHWPIPRGTRLADLQLTRIRKLLKALGNPEKKVPPVVHVTGTNGKGSVLAYLKAIFEAANYKVHRYTSPHLVKFNERIVLAGEMISDAQVYQFAEKCRQVALENDLEEGLTFFEGTTTMAFLAFAAIPADVLLLEVGMGGRFDATNVIDNPAITIITPISYDHVEYLGTTLGQIAYEKAGIIKSKRPCIVSWQHQEALEVLLQNCSNKEAMPIIFGREWTFQREEVGFTLKGLGLDEPVHFPEPNLFGIHQYLNSATSAAAALELSKQFSRIGIDEIRQGIANATWPARLERIQHGVLFEFLTSFNSNNELWLDGAHNPSGAEMIAASIRLLMEQEKANGISKPLYLINGRTLNRDVAGFLQHFKDIAEMTCCVKIQSEPLSEEAETIQKVAEEIGMKAIACSSLKDAIYAIGKHSAGSSRVLACGSLYLAGDFLAANI